jgi:signal transduction histidine kinase
VTDGIASTLARARAVVSEDEGILIGGGPNTMFRRYHRHTATCDSHVLLEQAMMATARRLWLWWARPDRHWWTDVALALAIGIVEILATHLAAQTQPERRTLDATGTALLAAGAAALVVRRRYPVVALGVAEASMLLFWLLGYPRGPVFLAVAVAVFTAATAGRRAVAWGALLIGFAAISLLPHLLRNEQAPSPPVSVALAGWMVVLAVSAEVVRVRREREVAALRTRLEEEGRRASDERLRIARELHDVLAHSISVINVQAAVALHLIEERPEQARIALTAIKDVSKDALRELRSVLAALRQPDEPPERAPAPSLANLKELVTRTAAGGLEVRTEIDGPLERLPASVDLAAFRILQEALTNVIRHAGTSAATVRVVHDGALLVLEVEDDGRGLPSSGGASHGTGIQGMRERAAALGGAVEAGPRPGGGFRVLARLPLDCAR